jgi:FlaA1/EpsC-like NDP-sugar epimerase
VLVLDMGSPVRISEVAKRLASEAPAPVDIVYTGLRPGEKLHENLFGSGEVDDRPVHPLISHVRVPPLDSDECALLEVPTSPAELRVLLQKVCEVAHPNGSAMITSRPAVVTGSSN